mmetsp:Transcript_13249/g.44556  ORF Transcript_13249/g.44556 Transcript_13249/m.44556 type:complete len:264 (+) Transcript_13249:423-1214(+)
MGRGRRQQARRRGRRRRSGQAAAAGQGGAARSCGGRDEWRCGEARGGPGGRVLERPSGGLHGEPGGDHHVARPGGHAIPLARPRLPHADGAPLCGVRVGGRGPRRDRGGGQGGGMRPRRPPLPPAAKAAFPAGVCGLRLRKDLAPLQGGAAGGAGRSSDGARPLARRGARGRLAPLARHAPLLLVLRVAAAEGRHALVRVCVERPGLPARCHTERRDRSDRLLPRLGLDGDRRHVERRARAALARGGDDGVGPLDAALVHIAR